MRVQLPHSLSNLLETELWGFFLDGFSAGVFQLWRLVLFEPCSGPAAVLSAFCILLHSFFGGAFVFYLFLRSAGRWAERPGKPASGCVFGIGKAFAGSFGRVSSLWEPGGLRAGVSPQRGLSADDWVFGSVLGGELFCSGSFEAVLRVT